MVIGYSALTLYVLWIFYLAVMNLYRAYDAKTITKTALYLGYPILAIGALLDLIVNVFIATVIFFELPRSGEWLTTKRLKRLKNDAGWRGKIANWTCANLLNSFDPHQNHCQ